MSPSRRRRGGWAVGNAERFPRGVGGCRAGVRAGQRRLREQGLTYSQLLEGLRHDLAIYLLRDPNLEASEVSRELGYRDPAIFTRAFRRWTGTTPSEFRRLVSVS